MARCPSLEELPAPPPGRSGWPWTEESARLGESLAAAAPRVTVITPSFNQAQFIEATIRSILLQGYPNLEYFVLDGGSTDGTVDILRRYSPWLDYWVSEPDRGQSDAINRGLRRATGSYAAWINSDDLLCRDALVTHVGAHPFDANVIYVGDCVNIDETDAVLSTQRGRVHSLDDLLRFRSVWADGGYISQPAVLFPLSLALRVGGVNEADHYSMDYELWGRFLAAGARVTYTEIPFGVFRRHQAQKTAALAKQIASTLDAAEALLADAATLDERRRRELATDLRAYRDEYPTALWRDTGRLARLGLPPSIVARVRSVKHMLGVARRSS